jgi:hypothetical protein
MIPNLRFSVVVCCLKIIYVSSLTKKSHFDTYSDLMGQQLRVKVKRKRKERRKKRKKEAVREAAQK